MIVIIACGGVKREVGRWQAERLYTGTYFRVALETAIALTRGDRSAIRILSGKHGLLELNTMLAPYEQRIDAPGAVTDATIRAQAEAQGLLAETDVRALCGSAYVARLRKVWPHLLAPLEGVGGIGYQMAALRVMGRVQTGLGGM